MKADWLWDKKISEAEVKEILHDENSKKFVELAAVLLSRNNIPREVFEEYLDKEVFLRNWIKIKRRMRQNRWNDRRIEFWQAVYEKILEVYKKKGFSARQKRTAELDDDLCKSIGKKIKEIRKSMHLTQKALANKMGISQQIISQIEKGRHNATLFTIKKIAKVLGKDIDIVLK